MPNTEVKLLYVDDTWWATAWESRKLPVTKAKGESLWHYILAQLSWQGEPQTETM